MRKKWYGIIISTAMAAAMLCPTVVGYAAPEESETVSVEQENVRKTAELIQVIERWQEESKHPDYFNICRIYGDAADKALIYLTDTSEETKQKFIQAVGIEAADSWMFLTADISRNEMLVWKKKLEEEYQKEIAEKQIRVEVDNALIRDDKEKGSDERIPTVLKYADEHSGLAGTVVLAVKDCTVNEADQLRDKYSGKVRIAHWTKPAVLNIPYEIVLELLEEFPDEPDISKIYLQRLEEGIYSWQDPVKPGMQNPKPMESAPAVSGNDLAVQTPEPSKDVSIDSEDNLGTQPSEPVENVSKALEDDLNGDGKITLEDAQHALRIALKIESQVTTQADAGEPFKTITLEDAQRILKKALKIAK